MATKTAQQSSTGTTRNTGMVDSNGFVVYDWQTPRHQIQQAPQSSPKLDELLRYAVNELGAVVVKTK